MQAFSLPIGDENTWLGAFGERWFRTICDAAACPAGKLAPDVVGTDFVVHDRGHETIRVQVKTTEHPTTSGDAYTHSLDIATYDRLRVGGTRGYLALVVMNSAHPRWTRHFRRGSVVAAGVYWACLAGEPETTNTTSITVSLPFANMLTPEKLLGLFPGGDEHG